MSLLTSDAGAVSGLYLWKWLQVRHARLCSGLVVLLRLAQVIQPQAHGVAQEEVDPRPQGLLGRLLSQSQNPDSACEVGYLRQ